MGDDLDVGFLENLESVWVTITSQYYRGPIFDDRLRRLNPGATSLLTASVGKRLKLLGVYIDN